MLTEEDKRLRQTGVGGSDLATILGLNPYQTAWELYYEKIGVMPDDGEDSLAQRMGHRLEDPIAREYAQEFQVRLRRRNQTVRHPKYDWLLANIDRERVKEKRGVEIKNVGWPMVDRWGPSGTDQVAEHYLPQPLHYMLVLDYPRWDVAAYLAGTEIRYYHLERDPEWDEIIIQTTHDFWHHHVLVQKPPEPDFSKEPNREALKRLYPGTNGETVELPPEAVHWDRVYQESRELAKRYDNAAQAAQAHILELIGEASRGVFPDGSGWERKKVSRKGYTVDAAEYVQANRKKELK